MNPEFSFQLKTNNDCVFARLNIGYDLYIIMEFLFPFQLKVFEAYKHGIHKFFGKGHSLSSVSASDKIFV